jgi:hypothetical protein
MAATYSRFVRIDFNATNTAAANLQIDSGQGLFLAYASREQGETGFTSVSYGGAGASLTDTGTLNAAGGVAIYGAAISGLSGNSSTSLSIVVNATPVFAHVYAIVYDNPDTSDMIGDEDYATGSSSPAQATNTSDANALHVAIAYWRDTVANISQAIQGGNGQTQVEAAQTNANGNSVYCSYRSGSGGGTAQTGYTFSSTPTFNFGAFRLNGTGSGGAVATRRLALMGAG